MISILFIPKEIFKLIYTPKYSLRQKPLFHKYIVVYHRYI